MIANPFRSWIVCETTSKQSSAIPHTRGIATAIAVSWRRKRVHLESLMSACGIVHQRLWGQVANLPRLQRASWQLAPTVLHDLAPPFRIVPDPSPDARP